MSQSLAINRDLSNDRYKRALGHYFPSTKRYIFGRSKKTNSTMKLLAAIVSTVFSQACGPAADAGGAFWPGQSPEGTVQSF